MVISKLVYVHKALPNFNIFFYQKVNSKIQKMVTLVCFRIAIYKEQHLSKFEKTKVIVEVANFGS